MNHYNDKVIMQTIPHYLKLVTGKDYPEAQIELIKEENNHQIYNIITLQDGKRKIEQIKIEKNCYMR